MVSVRWTDTFLVVYIFCKNSVPRKIALIYIECHRESLQRDLLNQQNQHFTELRQKVVNWYSILRGLPSFAGKYEKRGTNNLPRLGQTDRVGNEQIKLYFLWPKNDR